MCEPKDDLGLVIGGLLDRKGVQCKIVWLLFFDFETAMAHFELSTTTPQSDTGLIGVVSKNQASFNVI